MSEKVKDSVYLCPCLANKKVMSINFQHTGSIKFLKEWKALKNQKNIKNWL